MTNNTGTAITTADKILSWRPLILATGRAEPSLTIRKLDHSRRKVFFVKIRPVFFHKNELCIGQLPEQEIYLPFVRRWS